MYDDNVCSFLMYLSALMFALKIRVSFERKTAFYYSSVAPNLVLHSVLQIFSMLFGGQQSGKFDKWQMTCQVYREMSKFKADTFILVRLTIFKLYPSLLFCFNMLGKFLYELNALDIILMRYFVSWKNNLQFNLISIFNYFHLLFLPPGEIHVSSTTPKASNSFNTRFKYPESG